MNKQKEKTEVSQTLKEEKKKLQTLHEFLEKSAYISSKTKENSTKSQDFLKRFSEELEPILKKSYEVKQTVLAIDQAISNAKSKTEYLTNARTLEKKLSQKVQKHDLRMLTDAMDKAMIIFEFTKNDKHSNEYYAEVNDKIEKALEFAVQQLATLFAETVRDLVENNNNITGIEEDLDALMQIDQYLHKLGILDHFDTYIKLKERDFTKRIREIISISDLSGDEAYKKGSHPSLSGVTIFLNNLKQGKMEVTKIFNTADANLIYQNLVNGYYKAFLELTDFLIGPKNMFETNYQFFVNLDFVEKILLSADALKSALGGYYSAIEDVLEQYNIAFRNFIKNYSKVIVDSNKRPENEQISHITYKAIILVSQLQDYHKVLSNLNVEAEMSGAILKSVIKILEENRSFFKPKNQIIPLIYILNNFFYMISKTSSDDSEAVIDYTSKDMMDELFERHINEYLVLVWGNLNDTLSTNIEVAQEKSGKLKSSTRKLIKKKFAEFNHAVQDFQKLHKDLWYVSKEFTETLARKNKTFVLKKYQNFYNTFAELNFTKNREKYTKYTLSQLSEIIEESIKYSYASANKM